MYRMFVIGLAIFLLMCLLFSLILFYGRAETLLGSYSRKKLIKYSTIHMTCIYLKLALYALAIFVISKYYGFVYAPKVAIMVGILTFGLVVSVSMQQIFFVDTTKLLLKPKDESDERD